jgi:FkbM family methyltransferase
MIFLSNIFKVLAIFFSRVANFLHPAQFLGSTLIKIGDDDRDLYKDPDDNYFWLNKTSYVDECIRESGKFESASIDLVKKLVKPGDVVLDIGANIGYYSVILAKAVGVTGKIFAFEPTHWYRTVLERNVEANKLQNITIVPIGLSNSAQILDIDIFHSSATLHAADDTEKPLSSESIRLEPLDTFVAAQNFERIDFIKIDVDGHEPKVLEGAREILSKWRPKILLEVAHLNYLKAGYRADEFYKWLKENDYHIYHEQGLAKIESQTDFLVLCGNFAYSSNIIICKDEIAM